MKDERHELEVFLGGFIVGVVALAAIIGLCLLWQAT
jgi:hypothetical protein